MEDIIPGYDKTTRKVPTAMVELFQQNHRLKVDGIIGPITRGAIWRERGSNRYTYLAWHRVRNGGAERTKGYCARQLAVCSPEQLGGLEPDRVFRLCELVSSDWETGLDFLSTEDGITFGMRRLAAGTLRGFCERQQKLFARHGVTGEDIETLGDAPNNAYPLSVPRLRIAFIEAAADPAIWAAQFVEFLAYMRRQLDENPWARTAREIALLIRVTNSGSNLDKIYTRKYGNNYAALRRGYIERGGRGPDRVAQIERNFSATEVWR